MTLSTTARSEVFQQEGGGFLVLLTIDHEFLGGVPLRFVQNTVNINSQGHLFLAYPFEIKLPDDRDNSPPVAKLTIDNINREIVQTLRQIATAATVLVQVVRIEDYDDIEATLPLFDLRNVQWDALTLTCDLRIIDVSREPYPQVTYNPIEFPGLF